MYLMPEGPLSPAKDGVRHSLFFAVLLDVEAQTRFSEFADVYKRHHRLIGAPRPRRTFHVSLWSVANKMLGAPPQSVIELARDIGARVAASPFKAEFNRIEGWTRTLGSWPLVLVGDQGVIGLERLHEAVAEAAGARPYPGFTPHVTLMWGRDAVASEYVRPLSFTVREFALVHSHVGATHYDIKARFPLVYG